MIGRWLVSALLLVAGCSRAPSEAPAAHAPPPPPRNDEGPTSVESTAPAVSPAALRRHVEFLASDAMAGRSTPSLQLDQAARYIAGRFAELGLAPLPGSSTYEQRFDCTGSSAGPPSANVLALLPGSDPEASAVVVSAHYDHVGFRAARGDEDRLFNGANDNASGVAAMLEIAGALAQRNDPLRRPVLFMAFCGEELGLRGSSHYVSDPLWPLERMIAVINLEMLGRPEDHSPPRAWITGAEHSDLIDAFGALRPRTGVDFVSSRDIGPREANTFERSDNFPFASQGVVAHTVAAGRLDGYYHSVDDEADNLDYETMARLVDGIAMVVESLADGHQHPQLSNDIASP